tara:strand:+ start:616 stop:1179 length:564 start_codon:yes stop_codon:yes gene_type:complete
MFIQTEQTPNPTTLKFLPGVEVMKSGTADFRNEEEATRSPLASRLMKVDDIVGVFFGNDFVSVTKVDDSDWQILKPVILGIMMEHFVSQQPLIESEVEQSQKTNITYAEADSEIVGQIIELLETRVRPAVAQDGGDIEFRGFEKGVVLLQLHGSCQGCPSATMTLKMGVENMLKHYIPEVVEVRAVG